MLLYLTSMSAGPDSRSGPGTHASESSFDIQTSITLFIFTSVAFKVCALSRVSLSPFSGKNMTPNFVIVIQDDAQLAQLVRAQDC